MKTKIFFTLMVVISTIKVFGQKTSDADSIRNILITEKIKSDINSFPSDYFDFEKYYENELSNDQKFKSNLSNFSSLINIIPHSENNTINIDSSDVNRSDYYEVGFNVEDARLQAKNFYPSNIVDQVIPSSSISSTENEFYKDPIVIGLGVAFLLTLAFAIAQFLARDKYKKKIKKIEKEPNPISLQENSISISQFNNLKKQKNDLETEYKQLSSKYEDLNKQLEDLKIKKDVTTLIVEEIKKPVKPSEEIMYADVLSYVDKSFEELKNSPVKETIYKVFVKKDTASFEFHSTSYSIDMARNYRDEYIIPFCEIDASKPIGERIKTLQKGTLRKSGNKWTVIEKAKIAYE